MSEFVPSPAAHPEADAPELELAGGGEGNRPQEAQGQESDRKSGGWGLSVLRHAHFRNIWFAAFGSYVGNWFEFVAVRWIVAEEVKALNDTTVSAEDWMAYLSVAQLCPTLLLGMYGGLVADSVNRRSLLVATQGAMMAIAVVMATAAFTGHANRWMLLALCLAQGIAVPFNMPAWQVLTPRLVPKDELTQAITLNGISFNFGRTIGPLIAGIIMALFTRHITAGTDAPAETSGGSGAGAAALLLFNAVTFSIVMFAVWRTPDAPAPAEMRGAWRHPGVVLFRSLEALRWVWTHKGPRAVMLALVTFALLATPVMPLMVLVSRDVHGGKETAFGFFTAVMGLGAVSGGLAMRLVPKWYPMHHFIPTSVMLGGAFILAYALADSMVLCLAFLFFVGVFWMWGFNSTNAAMQHLCTESMRGRVSAVVNTIAIGFMPLGVFVASKAGHVGETWLQHYRPALITEGISTQLGLAFVAIILILAGVAMTIWRTPEVDGLTPGDPLYHRKPGLLRGVFATAHRPSNRTDAYSGSPRTPNE